MHYTKSAVCRFKTSGPTANMKPVPVFNIIEIIIGTTQAVRMKFRVSVLHNKHNCLTSDETSASVNYEDSPNASFDPTTMQLTRWRCPEIKNVHLFLQNSSLIGLSNKKLSILLVL